MPKINDTLPNKKRRGFLRGGGVLLGLSVLGFNLLNFDAWAEEKQKQKHKSTKTATPVPAHKPRPPRILVIDPGHGGKDPGTISPNGLYEKDVTLDIALRIADALAGKAGIEVKLTRKTDIFLPLADRVQYARDAKADLFVSIHADSATHDEARGLSVYTLSEEASDDLAGQLAVQENKVDLVAGVEQMPEDAGAREILLDLVTRRTRNTSQHTKIDFVHGIGRNWHLLENPVRSANFMVLRAPDMPSLLIETGFLTNKEDEALLSKPAQRRKVANLIAKNLANILLSPLFG